MKATDPSIPKRHGIIKLLPHFVFIFCLVACPSFGQGKQKKQLTAADYHLWSRLLAERISDGGQWVSYRYLYASHQDTLFVKSTVHEARYAFPRGKEGLFNGENDFACIGANDSLWVRNLKSGSLTQYPNIADFSFSGNGKYLLLLEKTGEQKKLVVLDRSGKILQEIRNVTNWRLEPERNGVMFSTAEPANCGVGLLLLDRNITRQPVATGLQNPVLKMRWKATTLAFIESGDEAIAYAYGLRDRKLRKYNPATKEGFPASVKISDYPYGAMIISDDGSKVFFDLKEKNVVVPSDADTVQVWGGNDKLLYPYRKIMGDYANYDKLAVWDIYRDSMLQVADKEFPVAILSGDYTHAIVYDPIAYEPQTRAEGPIDVYLMDLATGKRKLVIKKYTGDRASLRFSEQGRYFTYPRDGHWWVYDIGKSVHTNVTLKPNVPFLQNEENLPDEPRAYKRPEWTADGHFILLYDAFDVWAVSPDGKVCNRLTHGREISRTYRIAKIAAHTIYTPDVSEAGKNNYNLIGGLTLAATDRRTGESGLYTWTLKGKEKKLVWDSKLTSQYRKAKNTDTYILTEERYDLSPRLVAVDSQKRIAHKVQETNTQQQSYYWGKSELIQYAAMGKALNGALYFPANYQPGTKYPMVVEIYERFSPLVNEYVNPSVFNDGGFNISNFTTKGYFVLRPDFSYRIGEPGNSAAQCVLAAVDAVIAKGFVDNAKVGLIGHSFGGFETDFIITKTDRFAAAVSGSAITDLVSAYLYTGLLHGPDYYRTEHDQTRLGKSLFEDTALYLENSPVLHAAKVQTPLLHWTGAEDYLVDYRQSHEFYFALRRLQKKQTMLVYPGEGHSIWDSGRQADLTRRIEAWFGFYLKDDPDCKWMEAK
jgi:dipeptidyl aminopeptidase/acylaminoacyl peptidase